MRIVYVDGQCYGILASAKKTILFFSVTSRAIDVQGIVIHSVRTDSCGRPFYIAVQCLTHLYWRTVSVIHRLKNPITKLSVESQVLSTYKHKNWSHPRGLTAIGDGRLLVCNRNNYTVDSII